uniref:Ovule protein n=1 Tax=Steinernema glaseri TaxID=37863 RepID=A0A1I7YXW8_9BILA
MENTILSGWSMEDVEETGFPQIISDKKAVDARDTEPLVVYLSTLVQEVAACSSSLFRKGCKRHQELELDNSSSKQAPKPGCYKAKTSKTFQYVIQPQRQQQLLKAPHHEKSIPCSVEHEIYASEKLSLISLL